MLEVPHARDCIRPLHMGATRRAGRRRTADAAPAVDPRRPQGYKPPVTVSPARRIAAEVLLRVEQGGAFANLALDGALRAAGALEPREAALATELTYGTLRWQLQLDRALALHSRSEEHTSELQSPYDLVCRLLL